MSGTFQIFNLSGMPVRVHYSWIFVVAMLAWTLGEFYFPWRYPDWEDGRAYWVAGVVCALALFPCVLMHALGHSLSALKCRILVSGVTIFFLGGFCDLEREPRTALEEFRVAIGGPLTAVIMFIAYGAAAIIARPFMDSMSAVFECVALGNLSLALINLIPAYPLAGGSVLRAAVWRSTGNEARGTRAAVAAGAGLGFGLIAAGIISVFVNDVIVGVWMVAIGWFIQSTAASAKRTISASRDMDRAVTGRKVREAMDEGVRAVTPGTSVQSLLEDHAAVHMERAYLVMLGDTIQGLATLTDVERVPMERRSQFWVSEIMTRAPDLITIAPDAPLEDGLSILADRDVKQLVVMEDGKPIGMLTREGVVRVLEVALLLPMPMPPQAGDGDERK